MKNARISKAESGAPVQGHQQFTPRQLRALAEMLRRNVWRQELDAIAGCSNAPELVAQLRRLGLEVPCTLVVCRDRDGVPCRPGRYSLTTADRRKVRSWLARRPKAG